MKEEQQEIDYQTYQLCDEVVKLIQIPNKLQQLVNKLATFSSTTVELFIYGETAMLLANQSFVPELRAEFPPIQHWYYAITISPEIIENFATKYNFKLRPGNKKNIYLLQDKEEEYELYCLDSEEIKENIGFLTLLKNSELAKDFTIKSLFLRVSNWTIYDFVKGLQDLKNCNLRLAVDFNDYFGITKQSSATVVRKKILQIFNFFNLIILFHNYFGTRLNIGQVLQWQFCKLAENFNNYHDEGELYQQLTAVFSQGDTEFTINLLEGYGYIKFIFYNFAEVKDSILCIAKIIDEYFESGKNLPQEIIFSLLIFPAFKIEYEKLQNLSEKENFDKAFNEIIMSYIPVESKKLLRHGLNEIFKANVVASLLEGSFKNTEKSFIVKDKEQSPVKEVETPTSKAASKKQVTVTATSKRPIQEPAPLRTTATATPTIKKKELASIVANERIVGTLDKVVKIYVSLPNTLKMRVPVPKDEKKEMLKDKNKKGSIAKKPQRRKIFKKKNTPFILPNVLKEEEMSGSKTPSKKSPWQSFFSFKFGKASIAKQNEERGLLHQKISGVKVKKALDERIKKELAEKVKILPKRRRKLTSEEDDLVKNTKTSIKKCLESRKQRREGAPYSSRWLLRASEEPFDYEKSNFSGFTTFIRPRYFIASSYRTMQCATALFMLLLVFNDRDLLSEDNLGISVKASALVFTLAFLYYSITDNLFDYLERRVLDAMKHDLRTPYLTTEEEEKKAAEVAEKKNEPGSP